jgi:methionyl-tRNA synthetase
MCSDGWSYPDSEVNGKCPDCGMETVDGEAQEGCHYSPCDCDTCGYAPCDDSC